MTYVSTTDKIFNNTQDGKNLHYSPFVEEVGITGHPILRLAVSLAAAEGRGRLLWTSAYSLHRETTMLGANKVGVVDELEFCILNISLVFYTGSFAEPTPIVKGWLRVSHRAIDESHTQYRLWLPYICIRQQLGTQGTLIESTP